MVDKRTVTVSVVAKKEGMRISKNRPIANSADFVVVEFLSEHIVNMNSSLLCAIFLYSMYI